MQKEKLMPDPNTFNTSEYIELRKKDKKYINTLLKIHKRTAELTDEEMENVERINAQNAVEALTRFQSRVAEYSYYKPENKESIFVHFRPQGQGQRLPHQYLKASEFIKAYSQGNLEYVNLTLDELKISRVHVIELDDIGASLAYGIATDFSSTEYKSETETVMKINLFSGFQHQAIEGKVIVFIRYTVEILCSGSIPAAKFFLDWLADIVQHPGRMNPKAIILHSYDEGAGKNTLLEIIRRLLSLIYVAGVDPSMFSGTHNGALEGKIFAFADETFASSHQARDKLKTWIGNHIIPIRSMHQDTRVVKNCCRFCLSSNSDNMITIDKSNRRYVAYTVAKQNQKTRMLLDELYAWMDTPEAMPALMYYLQNRVIKSTFHGSGVPIFFPTLVESLTINSSTFSDPVVGWIRESQSSISGTPLACPEGTHTYLALHEKYRAYCEQNNIRHSDIGTFRVRIRRVPECRAFNIPVWVPSLDTSQKGCRIFFNEPEAVNDDFCI